MSSKGDRQSQSRRHSSRRIDDTERVRFAHVPEPRRVAWTGYVQRPKSAYTQIVDAVIPVATFAGGITLATQLIIQCPNTRLQALLATSSHLFLNVPLVLITIHIILYGKRDDDQVAEFKEYRPFIIAQFAVAGVEMAIAFILLSVAIYVADTSHNTVGIWGICLTAISVIIATLSTLYPLSVRGRKKIWDMAPEELEELEGASSRRDGRHYRSRDQRAERRSDSVGEDWEDVAIPTGIRSRHDRGNYVVDGIALGGIPFEALQTQRARSPRRKKTPVRMLQARRVVVLLGAILFQLTFAGIVVGFGAHAASTAPIQFGCPS
ncbi:hypothetical protein OQA88_5845 [Cercophora sp. LCS_1]